VPKLRITRGLVHLVDVRIWYPMGDEGRRPEFTIRRTGAPGQERAMRRGIAAITRPDTPPACPGCGRMLTLSDVHDGEMTGSCLLDSCRQRLTYRLTDGSWRVIDRSTLPAIADASL
jgi:hypothetical protein